VKSARLSRVTGPAAPRRRAGSGRVAVATSAQRALRAQRAHRSEPSAGLFASRLRGTLAFLQGGAARLGSAREQLSAAGGGFGLGRGLARWSGPRTERAASARPRSASK